MKIVLLSGWSSSGKDTVGKILERITNGSQFAFADALKEIVAKEFGFPLFWAYSQQGKQRRLKNGKTVREVLVQRGQEIRVEQNDSGYFARIVSEKIRASTILKDSSFPIIITDWRLPIELQTLEKYLPEFSMLKIRIKRADQLQSPVRDSETETQLDDWDFDCILQNDGLSLDTLENEIQKKLIPILHKK